MKTPPNSSLTTFIGGALERIAPTVLRWALGVTLLSAVADRFGLWGPPGGTNVSWGDWAHFVSYTAKVNSFLPPALAQGLAVLATAAELALGVGLLLGVAVSGWAFATLHHWRTPAALTAQ
jgi:putative oxidoreductase